MEIIRKENENEESFLWRIGQLIDNGEIESWRSITPIINRELGFPEDEWRDESTFRKKYKVAKKFYDNLFSKEGFCIRSDVGPFSIGDTENKNIDTLLKIKSERNKLSATKVELDRKLRHFNRVELFYENVGKYITTLPLPEFKYEFPDGAYNYPINKKEYLLTIADIHCGANFKLKKNYYSFDECKRRFELLSQDTIKYVIDHNIAKLNILTLGDDIQGILRLTDLQMNESTVVESTVKVVHFLSNFLNTVSSVCDIEYYHCPTSNHSQMRNLGSKANELATEDIEYVIGNYLKDILQFNDRVTIHTNFEEEYIDFKIFDFNIIAMHGHQIQNTDNVLKDLSYQQKKFYNICFLAHFHAKKMSCVGEDNTSDTEVIICPSFVGTDPYVDKRLFKGAKAACKIYAFDEEAGIIDTHKIILN